MRQMYGALHYSSDYAQLYAINQYMATVLNYTVLSVNYRGGVGRGIKVISQFTHICQISLTNIISSSGPALAAAGTVHASIWMYSVVVSTWANWIKWTRIEWAYMACRMGVSTPYRDSRAIRTSSQPGSQMRPCTTISARPGLTRPGNFVRLL